MIYVHGIGAVSPLGCDWMTTREALADGRSAVAPVTRFDVSGFPCTVAAAVDEAVLASACKERGIALSEDRRLPMAALAAEEALATLDATERGKKLGVFVGAESGRATFNTILQLAQAAGGGREFSHASFGEKARAIAPKIEASHVSPAAVATMLAEKYDARGPVQTLSLACSSSAAAIVEAVRAIRLGQCEIALCGGVGADVDPFMLAGFGLLGILSTRGVSRPFDAHRDGFVVGEGAAFIVLAKSPRSVRLAGVGRSLDAYHLTAPEPHGRGAVQAMRQALADAGVDKVDYVQAHATSTQVNDVVEAAAIRAVGLGDASVGGVKGALGHWVAGAGAISALTAIEAVASGMCMPTAGLKTPDANCALAHVMGHALMRPVRSALVNAFAFGGANSCLVFVHA